MKHADTVRKGLLVALALLCACNGSITNRPGKTGGSAGSDGGNPGQLGNDDGDDTQPPIPFEPTSPETYTAKVKNLLTGLPATDAEVAAVKKDPASLKGLIDGWLATPQAEDKLIAFFGKAFQQSQFVAADFSDQLGNNPAPAGVLENLRESFSRTALELMKEGRPFTETLTTQRFMLTPALASFWAYTDNRQSGDDFRLHDRLFVSNPNLKFTVENAQGAIPMSQTLDPTSPNYLTWYSATPFPNCAHTTRTFGSNGNTSNQLNAMLYGSVGTDPTDMTCRNFTTTPQFLPTDFTDWKMVTVRAPRAGETPIRFFDLPTVRSTTTLVLTIPRVGFFTTPAFFATWQTNSSNVARVTMNQTLIVALGKSFDGSSSTVPVSEAGLDAEHADPSTPCYACHKTLDPMRNFFRKNVSLTYHDQTDATQKATAPQFAFEGVSQPGSSLLDLGNLLANHPRFGPAWAQKVCFYADSAGCSEDDPELARVVGLFQASHFDFKVLLRELMASPLVTGASDTKTADDRGSVVSISRYDHLCAALTNRLGLADACNLNPTTRVLSTNIPSDAFSRGSEVPVLNSDTSLFFRTATENLCRTLADAVVDKNGARYQSTAMDAAVSDMVKTVMALPPSDVRNVPAKAILVGHFNAAKASGATPADSLKSTFVLACTSPTAVAIGL